MPYVLVGEETVRAPRLVTRRIVVTKVTPSGPRHDTYDIATKTPTGAYIETVFQHWKCNGCGGRACTRDGGTPGKCGKCKR